VLQLLLRWRGSNPITHDGPPQRQRVLVSKESSADQQVRMACGCFGGRRLRLAARAPASVSYNAHLRPRPVKLDPGVCRGRACADPRTWFWSMVPNAEALAWSPLGPLAAARVPRPRQAGRKDGRGLPLARPRVLPSGLIGCTPDEQGLFPWPPGCGPHKLKTLAAADRAVRWIQGVHPLLSSGWPAPSQSRYPRGAPPRTRASSPSRLAAVRTS
jgi:hypothetical protein